jgi:hypothetical protein
MANTTTIGNKMKITKRQLRRIIKEEKARLMNEMDPHAAGREAARMDDKVAGTIQMLQTAHVNLEDLTYDVDQATAQKINLQLALIEDAIHSLGGVI